MLLAKARGRSSRPNSDTKIPPGSDPERRDRIRDRDGEYPIRKETGFQQGYGVITLPNLQGPI